ncbi:MAG: UvrD-helicase domain-containing protein [Candidatus Shapirobacteria bacterium]|nr:UvrD-helicase domain-containing protein [Candidatus Shapirobacteria bacterium]MDD5073632.1 UvrD-helicase domain-containing protein [Candidatus Shapirobacteria bacterium]MDD5481407.1 UvrD-helicase domain-containing protein [Candidatus Shapirobacteria bacterium]
MSLLDSLNPQQKKAVCFNHGPLLILAGAGSGKTRVITYRTAYLIKENLAKPEEILCITFTNKAAQEMKSRLEELLSFYPGLPWTGTFHAFCARLLRLEGQAIGIPSNYLIWDRTDQLSIIKKIISRKSSQKHSPTTIINNISGAKNELIGPLDYARFAQGSFQELVAEIYLAYQKELRLSGALDFDDLLVKTVNLFDQMPKILEKYQEHYRYLFVDEYQDTNRAQYQLTKGLAQKHHNLCVVADASQSIYSWRGADYRNISRIQKDFPEIGVINLEQNYRSSQNILDTAYHVISQNRSHPILNLWTKNSRGEKITTYQAESAQDEAQFIIKHIITSKNQGRPLNDFAILYRTNAQSRILEEALLHYNIPYQLVGGFRFYERKEIKDILAFLKIIANPKDLASTERVRKIGKKILATVKTLTKNKKNQSLKTLEVINLVLNKTGYLSRFRVENEEDMSRLENIRELKSVALELPDLNQFLENIALMEQEYFPQGKITKEGQKKEKITLMTLHAAKGTEFGVVFLAGFEEGLLPHSRSLFDKESLEEERRLAYVGITRAKNKLFLTYASSRLIFGQNQTNGSSRFLADIPENLIDQQTISWL